MAHFPGARRPLPRKKALPAPWAFTLSRPELEAFAQIDSMTRKLADRDLAVLLTQVRLTGYASEEACLESVRLRYYSPFQDVMSRKLFFAYARGAFERLTVREKARLWVVVIYRLQCRWDRKPALRGTIFEGMKTPEIEAEIRGHLTSQVAPLIEETGGCRLDSAVAMARLAWRVYLLLSAVENSSNVPAPRFVDAMTELFLIAAGKARYGRADAGRDATLAIGHAMRAEYLSVHQAEGVAESFFYLGQKAKDAVTPIVPPPPAEQTAPRDDVPNGSPETYRLTWDQGKPQYGGQTIRLAPAQLTFLSALSHRKMTMYELCYELRKTDPDEIQCDKCSGNPHKRLVDCTECTKARERAIAAARKNLSVLSAALKKPMGKAKPIIHDGEYYHLDMDRRFIQPDPNYCPITKGRHSKG